MARGNKPFRLFIFLVALAMSLAACSGDSNAAPDPSLVDPDAEEEFVDSDDPEDAGDGGTDEEAVDEPIVDNRSPTGRNLTGSFTALGEPGVGGRITSIAFDPDNPDRVFVGGDLLGIAVTDDFGQSWQSTTGLASWEIADINTAQTADGRIWTGSLSGPQSSANGIDWALTRNGMPNLSEARYSLAIESILVDPNNNSRLLAFNGNQRNWAAPGAVVDGSWDGDGSVWQSNDSGQSWSQLAVVAPSGNIRSAAHNLSLIHI